MFFEKYVFRPPLALLLASSLSAAFVTPGFAADHPALLTAEADSPGGLESPRSSQNVTIQLINRLAERGALSKQDSAELLLMAEADAAEARAQAAMTQAALAQAAAAQMRSKVYAAQLARLQSRSGVSTLSKPVTPEASVGAEEASEPMPVTPTPPRGARAKLPRQPTPDLAETDANLAAPPNSAAKSSSRKLPAQTVPEVASEPPEEPLPPDTVRVTYVPEVVKNQLREEIKQEVMTQAREENWAAPRTMPDWVTRFRFFGDFRMRYDGIYNPTGNATGQGSAFWNYNTINTASTGFDYTGIVNPPFNNVDQSRNRVRLRVRLGAEADLSEGFTAGLRAGTGENNSPVTQNQTLGVANNGQGGNFGKYALWLDRAFLKYEIGGQPDRDLSITVGRFDSPFFSTSIIWENDLAFDGAVAKWKFPAGDAAVPFLTVGAFPVFNTDLNFATTSSTKTKSRDKWLLGSQLGATLEVSHDVNFKIAAAYYFFKNIEGKISTPFTPITAQDPGDTDSSRPTFAQRGNTYIALRNITQDTTNSGSGGVTNQWQYFGLATPFHEFAVTSQLDFNAFEPFQISLIGEYVKNVAFDRVAIQLNGPPRLHGPVNNNASDGNTFGGSGTGWNVILKLGDSALQKRWDWNVYLGYRKVGSDAVVDGFTDSDFAGGGTNFKGYTLGGSLALARHVWLSAKWMSATGIAGPVFKNDALQIDINGRF